MAFMAPLMAAIPAWVGPAMTVASTLMGAISQSNQFKAAAQADAYNAAVNRQRADSARATAGQREEQQRRFMRIEGGERRAAIAQSGTGLGGSNADVDRQSEIFAELDALNIRYEGQTESVGFLNQAALDDVSARNNRKRASGALWKGALGAATTALTSKW